MSSTFVLGGADDRFVPAGEVQRTALSYCATPIIVPSLDHTIMLEPRRCEVMVAMLTWLGELAARS